MKAGVDVGTIKDSLSIGSGGTGSYSWPISLSGSGGTGSDYKISVQPQPIDNKGHEQQLLYHHILIFLFFQDTVTIFRSLIDLMNTKPENIVQKPD